MRGTPYYEETQYHRYMLSRERRELFAPEFLIGQVDLSSVEQLLDFGCGNGFFVPYLQAVLPVQSHIWGAESQELLIDYTLRWKIKEGIERFTPFYVERTEHPLLPDWIPDPDLIFCSCVLSTFADPSLAISGIGRSLKNDGRILLLDWHRTQLPDNGPGDIPRMSQNRMQYCIEDAGFETIRQLQAGPYLYFLELEKGAKAKQEKNQFNYLNI